MLITHADSSIDIRLLVLIVCLQLLRLLQML